MKGAARQDGTGYRQGGGVGASVNLYLWHVGDCGGGRYAADAARQ